ncbi:hypothetical protein QUF95_18620 [Paenibacillus silvae]|uniref:hypothetical protein n=1 Tax=Paenibacillus silvae TaxID=1325358 RepID=UPI0025A0A303|nr:hypothetical protein [Paenibacillus silvae]MDM5279414.1 hypothetical protein [Paenibacillus silvae]
MFLIRHNREGNTPEVTAIIYNADPEQAETYDIWTDQAIPPTEDIPGMVAKLHIQLDSKILFYNYSKPKTWEDNITELQQQQQVMKVAIDDLILGGGEQ